MSILEKTANALGWSALGRALTQGIQFFASVVLARISSPYEFGLLGMVIVFTGFAQMFADFGFASALVQKEDLEDKHRTSVFWFQLGLGSALFALFIAGAPLVAWLYDEPQLTSLTRVVALNFVLIAFQAVQRALMQREMDFRTIALAETFAAIVSGTVGIGLALGGAGVYSLVALLLGRTAGSSAYLWYASGWRPTFTFHWDAVRELARYSMNLVGAQSLNYWSRNADNLIVGKVISADALGIYTRAYQVMMLPMTQVTLVVRQVMFPALSKVQNDKKRVRSIFLRTVGTVALLGFPSAGGLAVVAEDFVLALFGPKWTEVTPVLRILCVVGAIQTVSSLVGLIYRSQGRTDTMFRYQLVKAPATVAAFALGSYFGVIGVAWAYLMLVVSVFWLNFSIPGRFIELKVWHVLRELFAPLVCTATMVGIVSGVQAAIGDVGVPAVRLLLTIPTGVIGYTLVVWLWKPTGYREAMRMLRRRAS